MAVENKADKKSGASDTLRKISFCAYPDFHQKCSFISFRLPDRLYKLNQTYQAKHWIPTGYICFEIIFIADLHLPSFYCSWLKNLIKPRFSTVFWDPDRVG